MKQGWGGDGVKPRWGAGPDVAAFTPVSLREGEDSGVKPPHSKEGVTSDRTQTGPYYFVTLRFWKVASVICLPRVRLPEVMARPALTLAASPDSVVVLAGSSPP